jgi:16S rRNA (guanine966-N2)-methyltransferase
MAGTNQVRIIGGLHRGRRLPFANLPGLRPTGDRMRETLFNWLQPRILGARCLDLFAGSGALGLEAASRGADQVVMLDLAPQVVWQLRENVRLLHLPQVEVLQADALQWLRHRGGCFDILFLDPPFGTDLAQEACRLLLHYGWLSDGALLYLEVDRKVGPPPFPPGISLIKEQCMGQVWCGLARYYGKTASTDPSIQMQRLATLRREG